MDLYHVSQADAVPSIQRQGLRSAPPKTERMEDRRAMHRLIDTIGRRERADWVRREGAIYFWPTYDAARLYSARNPIPVLVEVDGGAVDAWMVPNQLVEQLFDTISRYAYNGEIPSAQEVHDHDELTQRAHEIVAAAQPWDGTDNDDLEVWAQPPIPASAITRVTNYDEEPL